jgi:glyoxylase-like metal-dependent hydrolase (beta-lactamase superfamily II)
MKDHLIVIEAPLHEERSLAVLAALESRFPGKPVRNVISTHFHNDHSGGLRAYAAVGATIVTGKASEAFVQKMLQAPHTYVPDSLQKASKPGVVEAVDGEKKLLTDGDRTVEAYPIPNGHAEGMLAAYVSHAKLLFVSDLFSPGAPRQPPGWPKELLDSITAAGIKVEHIVGGHGNKVATIAELRQAATP